MVGMRVLAQIAKVIFAFALGMIAPAALPYAVVLWMLHHTQVSESTLIGGYLIGITLWFFPTGADLLYRKFIVKKRPSGPKPYSLSPALDISG